MTAPLPKSPDDAIRWEFSRLVHRILSGDWKDDLDRRVLTTIGAKRKKAWGSVDLASNLAVAIWQALAKLYDRPPVLTHPEETAARPHLERVQASGIWALMQSFQMEILGLREGFIRVDVSRDLADRPFLAYRVVYPHEIVVRCLPDRPDRPVEIREIRRRQLNGRMVWAWDVLALVDELGRPAPRYQVVLHDSGEDVTKAILGLDPEALRGEGYPYRDRAGVPVLPYALYRAQKTGSMWNVNRSRGIVEATLNIAVKYTFLQHCEMNAAWIQRYGIDVTLPEAEWMDEERGGENGADDGDGAGRSAVVTDPTKVELFKSLEDARNPQLGAFPQPVSPAEMIETITRYERRCLSLEGIDDPEQIRMKGDPRSGYAVSVSRDAQRQAQRRYEPTFREGDLELVRLSAILWNRETGDEVPEDGYGVTYQGIPLSNEEKRAQREHLQAMIGAGLMSPIEAYIELHPGTTPEQARSALMEIAQLRRALAA